MSTVPADVVAALGYADAGDVGGFTALVQRLNCYDRSEAPDESTGPIHRFLKALTNRPDKDRPEFVAVLLDQMRNITSSISPDKIAVDNALTRAQTKNQPQTVALILARQTNAHQSYIGH